MNKITAKVEYLKRENQFKWSEYVELYIDDNEEENDFVKAYQEAVPKLIKKHPYMADGYDFEIVFLGNKDYESVELHKYYDNSNGYYDYWGIELEYSPKHDERFKPLMEYIKSEGTFNESKIQSPTMKRRVQTGSYSHGD